MPTQKTYSHKEMRKIASWVFKNLYSTVSGTEPHFSWEEGGDYPQATSSHSVKGRVMGRMLGVIEMICIDPEQRKAAKSQVSQTLESIFSDLYEAREGFERALDDSPEEPMMNHRIDFELARLTGKIQPRQEPVAVK